MFALIAAILFGIGVLLSLIQEGSEFLMPLLFGGLLFVALHMMRPGVWFR